MPAQEPIHRQTSVRPAAVAGMFYPADPGQLRREIKQYIQGASPALRPDATANHQPIKAIIAPHAGYPYSGPVAASAYAAIASDRGVIRRVVLIGPSHRIAFSGLAVSSAQAFDTPLGPVPVDTEATRLLMGLPGVHENDPAHAKDHALEVHLPLLLHVLGGADLTKPAGFTIVPILFGDCGHELAAKALDQLWGDQHTLIVISSDLSHYLDYDTATVTDRQTADAIVNQRPEDIGPDRACGHIAIRGLLACAQSRGLNATAVDLRNSGDTAGPRDRVVGYGAFIFN